MIRLDNLKVQELGKDKKSLCFTDYEGNNSKRIVLNAFPELFEDMERSIEEGEITKRNNCFPANHENIKKQNNYIIHIIAIIMVVLSLILFLPDSIKTYVLDHRDYTYYISDSMYAEATDGMDFILDKQYIEEDDGRISVMLYGFNNKDNMNHLIGFTENYNNEAYYFTEMNSNIDWLYGVFENKPD